MKKLFVLLLILTPLVATAQHSKPQHEPKTKKGIVFTIPGALTKSQLIPVISTSEVPNPADGFLINQLPATNYNVYFNATNPGYWITYSPINHVDTVHLNLSRMHVLNDSTFTIQ